MYVIVRFFEKRLFFIGVRGKVDRSKDMNFLGMIISKNIFLWNVEICEDFFGL